MVGTYKSGFPPGLSTPTLCPFFRIDLYRLFVEHGASCLVRCTKQLTQSHSLNFIMAGADYWLFQLRFNFSNTLYGRIDPSTVFSTFD